MIKSRAADGRRLKSAVLLNLKRNKIALVSNASPEMLVKIFEPNYDDQVLCFDKIVLSCCRNGGNRRGIEQSRRVLYSGALFFRFGGSHAIGGLLIDAQFLRASGRTRTVILAGQTLREVR